VKTNGIKVEGKSCYFRPDNELGFYVNKTPIKTSKEQIRISIPKYDDLKVAVFDIKQFQQAQTFDGDTLFGTDNSSLESIREERLKRAIENEGISISVGEKKKIIEPPILEQFYHNVRRKVQFVKRRKFYSEADYLELLDELKNQNGGMGIYLMCHLFKVFKEKKELKLQEACINRIKELTSNVSLDSRKYINFLYRWIKD
jgi:hypothetical protein